MVENYRDRPSASQKVVVAGQGYVGLAIAMEAVAAGFRVVGFDTHLDRVRRLQRAESYVDDISNENVRVAIGSGRYVPTAELDVCSDFDILVITVPTPLRDGIPDLSYIKQCAEQFSALVRPGSTIILESTTYPGTTEEFLRPIFEKGSGLCAGSDFCLGYSPERIDPGNTTWTFRTTPKVVAGVNESSLQRIRGFYDQIVDNTIPVSAPVVAELTKLLENTFRHVNIALVNELAMFAADLGVDVWEAIDAASTKPFGFMPFRPGPGVGGHCLPIDPSYLSWKVKQTLGMPFRFIELANDVNDHMPDYVSRRAMHILNRDYLPTRGSTVLVLGLTYKPNSNDIRESPCPILCQRLAGLGALVRASDPYVDPANFSISGVIVDATEEELSAAELVIVATDHDLFDWDLVQRASQRVLDTRHRLSPAPNVEYL